MKKMTGLFMATSILATVAVPVVQAADSTDPLKVDTNAKVNFEVDEEGETPTNPTDPNNPGEEITPPETGEGGSGGKGSLRIDWAPSFDFGTHSITGGSKDLVLPVVRSKEQVVPHFLQVSDLRGEDKPNWTVSVTAAKLKRDAESEIKGANLSFTPADILVAGETGPTVATEAPVWAAQTINLDGGEAQTLVTAKDNGARGTWSMGMSTKAGAEVSPGGEDTDINLMIPKAEAAQIKKGEYTSTLNWVLSSEVDVTTDMLTPTTK